MGSPTKRSPEQNSVAKTENQVREAIRGGMDPVDAYLKFRKF